MTGEEFAKFCDLARRVRKWPDYEIAQKLGCGRNQIRRWKRNGAPPYIGLALTCLSEGWSEWTYEDGGRPDLTAAS